MPREVSNDEAYVLHLHNESKTGTLYTGMTNTIFGRSRQHKEKLIKGFASKYGCDRLVYYEGFDDVRKAISREKELKGWTRMKKIALIESVNPRWEDLSKTWGWQMLMANEAIRDQKKTLNSFEAANSAGILPFAQDDTDSF